MRRAPRRSRERVRLLRKFGIDDERVCAEFSAENFVMRQTRFARLDSIPIEARRIFISSAIKEMIGLIASRLADALPELHRTS